MGAFLLEFMIAKMVHLKLQISGWWAKPFKGILKCKCDRFQCFGNSSLPSSYEGFS